MCEFTETFILTIGKSEKRMRRRVGVGISDKAKGQITRKNDFQRLSIHARRPNHQ